MRKSSFISTIICIATICSCTSEKGKTKPTSSITTMAETQEITNTIEPPKEEKDNKPKVFTNFQLNFWDSLKVEKYPTHKKNNSEEQHKTRHTHFKNRSHTAFAAGREFAKLIAGDSAENETDIKNLIEQILPNAGKIDSTTNTTANNVFYNFINETEQQADVSVVPFAIAGNYFGMLNQVASNINPQTGLPDEITLTKGIEGLSQLKEYFNSSLQESSDIKLNEMLQKLSSVADSCKAIYEKCNTIDSIKSDKYKLFKETLQQIESMVFETQQ